MPSKKDREMDRESLKNFARERNLTMTTKEKEEPRTLQLAVKGDSKVGTRPEMTSCSGYRTGEVLWERERNQTVFDRVQEAIKKLFSGSEDLPVLLKGH